MLKVVRKNIIFKIIVRVKVLLDPVSEILLNTQATQFRDLNN